MKKGSERQLTYSQAVEIFKYDPETGIISWKVDRKPTPCRTFLAGEIAGYIDKSRGYWRVGINNCRIMAHRLVWLLSYCVWPDKEIDHINGNRSDNRLKNLRLATHSENMWNRKKHKNNVSGFPGVTWCKGRGKWQALIRCKRIRYHLGYFDDKNNAIAARERKLCELHGGFSRKDCQ